MNWLKTAGVFRAKAIDAFLGETSKKHSPYVGLTFRITEGLHAGEHVEAQLWLSDRAIDWTVVGLIHCGWKHAPDIDNLEGVGDKEVEIVVELEQTERGEYTKVRYINSLESKRTRLSGERAAELAKRMRGPIAAAQQKLAGATPPAAADLPGFGDGDDIPF